MKKSFYKIISAVTALICLSSCSTSSVLKTKVISKDITQTSVILKSDALKNEEYANYFSEFTSDFTVPGLYEGFIPQGICYSTNGSYIISGYFEDGALPSVLISIDADSGKLKNYCSLKNIDGSDYYGHAGGIACSGDYIFITSDGECYTMNSEAFNNAKSGSSVHFESKFKITTEGSFATYYEGVLWIGDFIESSDDARKAVERITTLESGETFYAYCEGYTLENGLPSVEKINSTADGYIPDHMIAIPEQVQGMSFTKTGKIIFSTSYGRRNDSVIYIFNDIFLTNRVGTVNIDGCEIDLLACSSEQLYETLIAPPMAEGITSDGDTLCMIFESGASKYRSHRGKYPVETAYKAVIE